MIEPQQWVAGALAGLKREFGSRLLYLGLQGSYRRGEATESSDIDLVALLDQVALDDLDVYRGLVRALPEGDKACGFICGAAEFAHWPRHELFPFKMDTVDYYGQLDAFLPPISRSDIVQGVRIGASGLIHLLTHSYLYAGPEDRPAILGDAYKAAFFSIQAATYLLTGTYHSTKKQLLENSPDPEKRIVSAGLDFSAWLSEHSEKQAFDLLLTWGRQTLIRDFKP